MLKRLLIAVALVVLPASAHAQVAWDTPLLVAPRDMPGFVKELSKVKFTSITGVNTLFNGLLNTPGFDKLDFSQLRLTLGGGMAVQRAVAERWKQVTGVTLVEAYGLTETSPAACINPMDLAEYNGSIGLPVPSTDACIKDENGVMLPVGEVGELCIKGPQVMKGYWNRPEDTAQVIDADGWLHTGDLGRIDDEGFLYVEDRIDDMIVSGGENIVPAEIEGVLLRHPEVADAAVVGREDPEWQQAVTAVVVLADGSQATPDELRRHCAESLAGFKVPKRVELAAALPRTPSGKLLRRALR